MQVTLTSMDEDPIVLQDVRGLLISPKALTYWHFDENGRYIADHLPIKEGMKLEIAIPM